VTRWELPAALPEDREEPEDAEIRVTRVFRRTIRGVGDWPPYWDKRSTRFGCKIERLVKLKLLGDARRFVCFYCGVERAASAATLEHIIPLACGGTYAFDNLVLACARCNDTRNRLVCDILAGKADRWLKNNACVLKGIVHKDGRWFFDPHVKAA
jgi:hypothetical protein